MSESLAGALQVIKSTYLKHWVLRLWRTLLRHSNTDAKTRTLWSRVPLFLPSCPAHLPARRLLLASSHCIKKQRRERMGLLVSCTAGAGLAWPLNEPWV